MNKIFNKLFKFNLTKWEQIRNKGLKHYILVTWGLKIGVLLGSIGIISLYIINIGFEFNLRIFLSNYVVWLPVVIVSALVCAIPAWHENEEKYNRNK